MVVGQRLEVVAQILDHDAAPTRDWTSKPVLATLEQ
jgi:hypothetical protein